MLADDLMVGQLPVMVQMVEQFETHRVSILAIQNVSRKDTRRYGVVAGSSIHENLVDLDAIIEKSTPDTAPSTLAVVGRYILTPSIFAEIQHLPVGMGGDSTYRWDSASLLRNEKVLAYRFKGRRYDCGSKLGFLQANVELAECHQDIGIEFTRWLQQRNS